MSDEAITVSEAMIDDRLDFSRRHNVQPKTRNEALRRIQAAVENLRRELKTEIEMTGAIPIMYTRHAKMPGDPSDRAHMSDLVINERGEITKNRFPATELIPEEGLKPGDYHIVTS